jgi:hypothetical protein
MPANAPSIHNNEGGFIGFTHVAKVLKNKTTRMILGIFKRSLNWQLW